MGNACGKVARKSDFFKKVNAARLYRKSLFSRFRVKLNKKGNPRFCHTWGRHGATRTEEWQKRRIMGLLEKQGVPQTDTPSWFHDKQAEMYAREMFLRENKEEMDRRAAEIEADLRNGRKEQQLDREFQSSIFLPIAIGVGLDARHDRLEFHSEIKHVKFSYFYENETWYEVTGYADIRAHIRANSGGVP